MTAERERLQSEVEAEEEELKEQAAEAEKKEQALADMTAERETEAAAKEEALKEQGDMYLVLHHECTDKCVGINRGFMLQQELYNWSDTPTQSNAQ